VRVARIPWGGVGWGGGVGGARTRRLTCPLLPDVNVSGANEAVTADGPSIFRPVTPTGSGPSWWRTDARGGTYAW
jgi:hypothetical protein